jgi:anti-sigma regulatory factor (Ser/Thr protein kinase)
MRVELPLHPSSAGLARGVVRGACRQANVDGDIALLCASELVTNALVHGAPPIELEVVVTGRCLRVAIYDGSMAEAVPRHPVTADATSGRGLGIVEALATRWSVERTGGGKVVWFELHGS